MNHLVFINSEEDIGIKNSGINKFLSDRTENVFCYVFCDEDSNSNIMKKVIEFANGDNSFRVLAINHIIWIKQIEPGSDQFEVHHTDKDGGSHYTMVTSSVEEIKRGIGHVSIKLNDGPFK